MKQFKQYTERRGKLHYGVADMTTKSKTESMKPSQEEIDRIVEAQAGDDSAWEEPFRLKRPKQLLCPFLPISPRELLFWLSSIEKRGSKDGLHVLFVNGSNLRKLPFLK